MQKNQGNIKLKDEYQWEQERKYFLRNTQHPNNQKIYVPPAALRFLYPSTKLNQDTRFLERLHGYLTMSILFLRRLYNTLIPIDSSGMEAFEKIKPNAVVKCEVTRPRNIGYHRRFFALLDLAFDAWEMPETEYRGQKIQKNRERFRKDLLIMAGHYEVVVNLKGELRYEAKSMSFANMAQDEFEALYSSVVDVILQKVMSTYTRGDLDRVIEEIIGFC